MRAFFKTMLAAVMVCLLLVAPPMQSALANDEVTADTPFPDIVALQAKVDEASALYDVATQNILDLQVEIDELNERIWEIRKELPEARKVSNAAAKEYYCLLSTSNQFLEVVLGASSLADFFAKVEYSARLNQSFLDDISRLTRINEELKEALEELEEINEALVLEQERAEQALIDARNAQTAAKETALRIAEATAAATAAAAEAAAAINHTPEAPLNPSPVTGVNPGLPESPSEKQAFVDLWTPRIDAYLLGSPLEGFGYAFANAAYDYNVDPRWSPAIACLESSKGRYCFLPHNAWGWGQISWPDWETAIFAHVRGLSIGYGYTISIAAAQKYCPPNWEHWYNVVSSEMARI